MSTEHGRYRERKNVGNGEGDDDDVVVDDSGGNGDRGGVEGGLVNKGDDKGRNGAYLSENRHCDGNGIAVELDSLTVIMNLSLQQRIVQRKQY